MVLMAEGEREREREREREENEENDFFYKKSQVFFIRLPSICENRHTVFTKVVDNGPVNISGMFEACN